MTRSESGQVCMPDDPSRKPDEPGRPITMAAAPSPNKAAPMMLLLDMSPRRKVTEHSSTARNSTSPSGSVRASAAAWLSPITPPAQPSPKIGRRRMVDGRSRRLSSTASRLGVAMPVVETTTTAAMSLGLRPASSSASVAALASSSTAFAK